MGLFRTAYHIHTECRSTLVREHLIEALNQVSINQGEVHLALHHDDSSAVIERDPDGQPHLLFYELEPENLDASRQQFAALRAQLKPHNFQFVLICHEKYNYIELAKEFNLGNIIIEQQFDWHVLWAMIQRLLGPRFFGLAPFFPRGFREYELRFRLSGQVQSRDIVNAHFSGFLSMLPKESQTNFRFAFGELIVNALSYAVVGISPEKRDQEQESAAGSLIEVPREQALEIHLAQDAEKWGLSICDRSGSLTLERVLDKLGRQLSLGEDQLPIGIDDFSGRGLFLLSRQNRLVINILTGVRTEIIVMHFNEAHRNTYQSLIINEREPDRQIR